MSENVTAAIDRLSDNLTYILQHIWDLKAVSETALIMLIIALVILALFNALAFWQRHVFLYILVAIGDIVFGLYYAASGTVYETQWVLGVLVVILGLFCMFRAVMKLITEARR